MNPDSFIERDEKIAKFWLDPVRIQTSGGFTRAEIALLEKLVNQHNKIFQEKWDAYFNG
ncbi:MAG: DUF4160 domain-containing protein [Spirochaetia bacterium]|nr:DUF4160 domain-containing protein [Spirochaetia bacterium]